MRLAFFTSIIPDGMPKSGYEIANEAIVAGLRQLGHDVVVIGFRLPRQAHVSDSNVIVLDERDLENAGGIPDPVVSRGGIEGTGRARKPVAARRGSPDQPPFSQDQPGGVVFDIQGKAACGALHVLGILYQALAGV